MSHFCDRLRANEPQYRLGIRSARTTEIVRIAKAAGYHSIMVDLEHCAMSIDTATEICAAAGDAGLMPSVRLPERDFGSIGRLLDGGADGMLMPGLETVEQAKEFADFCRFAPNGKRSQLSMVPQLGMKPTPATELNPALDNRVVVQILLESKAGIGNAEAIAALPGVDMVTIGANDLSAELGIPGKFADPLFVDAVKTVIAACKTHNKIPTLGGIGDPALVRKFTEMGMAPFYLVGFDTEMMYSMAVQRKQRLADALTAAAE